MREIEPTERSEPITDLDELTFFAETTEAEKVSLKQPRVPKEFLDEEISS